MELTKEELTLLIESMEYTIKAIREYEHYPDHEFRRERLSEAIRLQTKLREMRGKQKDR